MFLIIMQKQQPEQNEQTYALIPYYRWWSNWSPYYYGSGSNSYYSTYRYPRHKHRRHRRSKNKNKNKNKRKIHIVSRKANNSRINKKKN